MANHPLIPIVMGFFLTISLSILGFIYGQLDDIKGDIVSHRVQLAQLITPGGDPIQSMEVATARQVVADRLNALELEVKLAGQEERANLENQLTALLMRVASFESFKDAPSRSAGEVEKIQMELDFIYRELTDRINRGE